MLQRLVFRSARHVLPALVLFWMAACGGDSEEEQPSDKCKVDAECGGGTPVCGAAGVCVACLDNSQCSGATPVCDLPTNTCRGCAADSECASGVCLASQATCATEDQLVYVKEAGGADTGMCEKNAPCATINYAKNRATGARNVIRVIGNLTAGGELQSKVFVDGDGGTWTAAALPVLGVGTNAADVTIEGLTIAGPAQATAQPVVQCLNGASLRFHNAAVKLGSPGIFSVCKLSITKSEITEVRTAVDCMDGAVTIEQSKISGAQTKVISGMNCSAKLSRNEITGTPTAQALVDLVSPPMLSIENNLLWDKTTLASNGITVSGAPTGGTIRFNTLVATAAGAHSGDGVICSGTAVVSSNVIAWQNGAAVVTNPCARRFNAFDAMTPVGVGEGNTSGTLANLFVNPASDFHPAASSPARDLADPNDKVSVDLEGKPRSATGRLDAGAYEVQ